MGTSKLTHLVVFCGGVPGEWNTHMGREISPDKILSISAMKNLSCLPVINDFFAIFLGFVLNF